ncbi:solute carrier family 23 member 1-like [Diadema antillarum]|uniref:solute carrier family 23 member 1-like n=1 Tax=Diadema antillarum TaxID=105358 RepID=UPI003A8ACFD6
MSDQEFSREQDHTLGSDVPIVSQPATLTPSFVSNAIKEAFGSFKEYFDSSIAQVKEESEKKLSAASTELQQLKRASELSFSFKGNRVQFEFNSSLQEKLEKGVALLEEGKHVAALSKLKEGIADIRKRKKLIRLADKSDAEKTVMEEIRLADVDDPNITHIEIDKDVNTSVTAAKNRSTVIYGIDDRPPWYSTFLLAMQHFLSDFTGLFATPLILAPYLCIHGNLDIISKLVSTQFVVAGIQTFLQTTFGSRLPIVQGPSFTFLLPAFSLMNVRGDCPAVTANATNASEIQEEEMKEFQVRIQELSGAVLVASIFEIVVGFAGITSLFLRFIGPLTIAPTIGLIGLSLFNVASSYASQHWGIAGLTLALIAIFSQYLDRVNVPCPGLGKTKRFKVVRFPLFKLFPVVLALLISWLFCCILTVTNVFPDDESSSGYRARTDLNHEQLSATPWYYIPYPGQWGPPRITAPGVLGMMAGCTASIVESIGDYYACARIAGAPPLPPHAVNRGIGMEGVGGIISALWGTGVGATSYSQNIGVIGITKVGSRFVVQVMSFILLVFGLWLKAGAVLVSIPAPVIGGVMAATFGMVAAVGFSNLQFVNLNSSRNLFILGTAFYIGIAGPTYINENRDSINTGSETFDQILVIILGTSMFLGGTVGCILDNTIPGSPEERGMIKFSKMQFQKDDEVDVESDLGESGDDVTYLVKKCYDFPFGMKAVRRWKWTKRVPFCPTFTGFRNPFAKVNRCRPKI